MTISIQDQLTSLKPFIVPYTDQEAIDLLSEQLQLIFSKVPLYKSIVFVCIGTDRSTGDALGPLVGSFLQKNRLHQTPTIGTIEDPVHAVNLEDTLSIIKRDYKHPFIVGIDACLGKVANVGNIQIGHGPVKPGAGVNKELPPVGDIHITGTVNVGGFMEYFVLQNTRLSLVMKMAEIISDACYLSLLYSHRIHSTVVNLE